MQRRCVTCCSLAELGAEARHSVLVPECWKWRPGYRSSWEQKSQVHVVAGWDWRKGRVEPLTISFLLPASWERSPGDFGRYRKGRRRSWCRESRGLGWWTGPWTLGRQKHHLECLLPASSSYHSSCRKFYCPHFAAERAEAKRPLTSCPRSSIARIAPQAAKLQCPVQKQPRSRLRGELAVWDTRVGGDGPLQCRL